MENPRPLPDFPRAAQSFHDIGEQMALIANVPALNDAGLILRELREGFRRVNERFERMDQRFDHLENSVRAE